MGGNHFAAACLYGRSGARLKFFGGQICDFCLPEGRAPSLSGSAKDLASLWALLLCFEETDLQHVFLQCSHGQKE